MSRIEKSNKKRSEDSFYNCEAVAGVIAAGIKTEKFARKQIKEQRSFTSFTSDYVEASKTAYNAYKQNKLTEIECGQVFFDQFNKMMQRNIDFANAFESYAFRHHN